MSARIGLLVASLVIAAVSYIGIMYYAQIDRRVEMSTGRLYESHYRGAYEDGVRAYRVGVPPESNPFQGWYAQSKAWLDGYMDAKEQKPRG